MVRLMMGIWTRDFPDRETAMDSRPGTVWEESHEGAVGYFVEFAADGTMTSDAAPYCRIIELGDEEVQGGLGSV